MKRKPYRVRFDEERGCDVKRCTRCHVEKPVTEFYTNAGGEYLHSRCKPCDLEMKKARYDANPDKYRAYAREYGQSHQEERSERFKRWYGANRERNIARVVKWRNDHLEYRLAYEHARNIAIPPEKRAAYYRTRAARGYFRAWAILNIDRRRAADRRYKQRHPESRRIQWYKRMSIIRATAGAYRMTRADIIARDGAICYLCGIEFPHNLLTIEHVIPLSRGGGHTPDNLRVACGPCNSRKGAKLLD